MRIRTILLASAALAVAAPATASAQGSHPWNGVNPFRCDIQDVGTGTKYPKPKADPFCVEYDKTQQNVLPDAGLVDFLSKEPARTAAASTKCFYFQRDHWTGWVIQDSQPVLWHWDGDYFFDKATGAGGVSFHNLTLGGVLLDGSQYAPKFLQPYLYPGGGGGGAVRFNIPADPSCAAKVATRKERRRIYSRHHRHGF